MNCIRCDRPLATPADHDANIPGCEPVDWRARALATEAALARLTAERDAALVAGTVLLARAREALLRYGWHECVRTIGDDTTPVRACDCGLDAALRALDGGGPHRREDMMGGDICTCGHVRDEHGDAPEYPGSTECGVDGCDCVAFELGEAYCDDIPNGRHDR